MRLHLTLSPNTQVVPFNYQHQLTGAVHKWLGDNDLHDKISLYSFSWLRGQAERVKGGLHFPTGAHFMLNFWEADYSSKLIQGIVDDSEVMYGIEVEEVRIGKTPTFENPQKFKVASPVLIRKNVDPQKRQHLTYKDSDVDDYLSRTVITKLKEIGESKPDISIKFDRNYPNPKTKLVDIKGSKLRTNLCPVIITGDLKHIEFAWTVGIGELTGSGFGALY